MRHLVRPRLLILRLIFWAIFAIPLLVNAQAAPSAVAISVPISGSEVAYGDLIDYDRSKETYFISQYADDPRVFGVAVKNPPIVLLSQNQGNVPVLHSGAVLVNVTLENGPIQVGDPIVASSIGGKGMRARARDRHVIGNARESFTGQGAPSLVLQGENIPAGTIIVDLANGLGQGTASSTTKAAGALIEGCTGGNIPCLITQKIDATPLVTLMRYLLAAFVTLGSLYLAFRSFMADAVNGVISVGRNPRAKLAIQSMVVFNGLLAGFIALAGLGVGLLILFVQL